MEPNLEPGRILRLRIAAIPSTMRLINHAHLVRVFAILAAVAGVGTTTLHADEPPAKEVRFEKDIQAFEAKDKENPPQPGQIVFVGSSSVRMWKLAESFPKLDALNRGFGGSHISDCVVFAKRIVTPYKPRVIVFYAGDNDLAAGKSPEQVAKDFQAFVEAVRPELPDMPILFIAIKPSPSRVKLMEKQRAANKLIHDYIDAQKHITFVDIFPLMLNAEGQPRPELYRDDKLHMTAEGYMVWAEKLGEVSAEFKMKKAE